MVQIRLTSNEYAIWHAYLNLSMLGDLESIIMIHMDRLKLLSQNRFFFFFFFHFIIIGLTNVKFKLPESKEKIKDF